MLFWECATRQIFGLRLGETFASNRSYRFKYPDENITANRGKRLGEAYYNGRNTNSMELSPSWEVSSCWGIQDTSSILWMQKFITMFTETHNWLLACTRQIHSTCYHPISLEYILIFSSYLC
jgi:hypothetical protein